MLSNKLLLCCYTESGAEDCVCLLENVCKQVDESPFTKFRDQPSISLEKGPLDTLDCATLSLE